LSFFEKLIEKITVKNFFFYKKLIFRKTKALECQHQVKIADITPFDGTGGKHYLGGNVFYKKLKS
jgi:hypothetical protein